MGFRNPGGILADHRLIMFRLMALFFFVVVLAECLFDVRTYGEVMVFLVAGSSVADR